MPATHTCSCIHAGMPDRLDAAAVFSHCFLRSMHFGPFLSPSHPFLYYFMVEFFVSLSLCSLSLRYLNPLPSSQHYSTYSIENIPLIFDKLVFISGPFRVFWLDFHSASFLSTYFFFVQLPKHDRLTVRNRYLFLSFEHSNDLEIFVIIARQARMKIRENYNVFSQSMDIYGHATRLYCSTESMLRKKIQGKDNEKNKKLMSY